MGCLIRDSKLIILILFSSILVEKTLSQNCAITVTEFSPIYLNDLGKIQDVYLEMKLGDTSRIHLMYINILSQLNKKEAFYLGIEPRKKIEVTAMNYDSTSFTRCISTKAGYDFDFLLKDSISTGFYVSNCKNVVSSHRRSVLLIFDAARRRWIEYTSMDGYMKEALAEDAEYKYLRNCYDLIVTVFKDFKVADIE